MTRLKLPKTIAFMTILFVGIVFSPLVLLTDGSAIIVDSPPGHHGSFVAMNPFFPNHSGIMYADSPGGHHGSSW